MTRDALRVPPDVSLSYELYDPTPMLDIDNPAVVEPLRAHAVCARQTIEQVFGAGVNELGAMVKGAPAR